jgi:hypothetical protein
MMVLASVLLLLALLAMLQDPTRSQCSASSTQCPASSSPHEWLTTMTTSSGTTQHASALYGGCVMANNGSPTFVFVGGGSPTSASTVSGWRATIDATSGAAMRPSTGSLNSDEYRILNLTHAIAVDATTVAIVGVAKSSVLSNFLQPAHVAVMWCNAGVTKCSARIANTFNVTESSFVSSAAPIRGSGVIVGYNAVNFFSLARFYPPPSTANNNTFQLFVLGDVDCVAIATDPTSDDDVFFTGVSRDKETPRDVVFVAKLQGDNAPPCMVELFKRK